MAEHTRTNTQRTGPVNKTNTDHILLEEAEVNGNDFWVH